MGSKGLVIREAQNVISVAHVVGVHDIRIVWTFVYALVHPGVGVQAGAFPAYGCVQVSIWVVYPVSAERHRAFEPVYGGNTENGEGQYCRQQDGGQDFSENFEKFCHLAWSQLINIALNVANL